MWTKRRAFAAAGAAFGAEGAGGFLGGIGCRGLFRPGLVQRLPYEGDDLVVELLLGPVAHRLRDDERPEYEERDGRRYSLRVPEAELRRDLEAAAGRRLKRQVDRRLESGHGAEDSVLGDGEEHVTVRQVIAGHFVALANQFGLDGGGYFGNEFGSGEDFLLFGFHGLDSS